MPSESNDMTHHIFDLDGTLCESGASLTLDARRTVLRLLRNGHGIHVATARNREHALEALAIPEKSIGMICSESGAFLSKRGETLHTSMFERSARHELALWITAKTNLLELLEFWDRGKLATWNPHSGVLDLLDRRVTMGRERIIATLENADVGMVHAVLANEGGALEIRGCQCAANPGGRSWIIKPDGNDKSSILEYFSASETTVVYGDSDNDLGIFQNNAKRGGKNVRIGNNPVLAQLANVTIGSPSLLPTYLDGHENSQPS